jgi:D-proline reductase (dithiol) PrdB
VGLVARALESQGIATIALSIVREITEKTLPPRALHLRFPFGHALGEALNVNQQMHVLRLAFMHLFSAQTPGETAEAGLRWRRESYLDPNWTELRRIGPKQNAGLEEAVGD